MPHELLGPLASLVGVLLLFLAGFLWRPKRPSTFMGMRVEYRDDIPPGEIWMVNPEYFQSPVVMTDAVARGAGSIKNVQ